MRAHSLLATSVAWALGAGNAIPLTVTRRGRTQRRTRFTAPDDATLFSSHPSSFTSHARLPSPLAVMPASARHMSVFIPFSGITSFGPHRYHGRLRIRAISTVLHSSVTLSEKRSCAMRRTLAL
jgi:hypothetical protein